MKVDIGMSSKAGINYNGLDNLLCRSLHVLVNIQESRAIVHVICVNITLCNTHNTHTRDVSDLKAQALGCYTPSGDCF